MNELYSWLNTLTEKFSQVKISTRVLDELRDNRIEYFYWKKGYIIYLLFLSIVEKAVREYTEPKFDEDGKLQK